MYAFAVTPVKSGTHINYCKEYQLRMKKRISRLLSCILAVALLVTALPAANAYAVLSEVRSAGQVTTFKSTTTNEKESVRGYVTDEHTLKVICKTQLQTTKFRVSLYRIGENKGDINLDIFVDATQSYASDGTTLYGFTYYLDMERFAVPDGYYNLYLRRCATAYDAETNNYKSSGVLYKNMEIKVTNGKVKILRFKDVINYNNSIRKENDAQYSTSRYLDDKLMDIRFVLRNPATDVFATMTDSKIAYIKTVSDRIVSGATSNYEKLRKIYEYTAKNFYYDSIAFSTGSLQYADPYDNIYNFENGRSSANSSLGRVYTTCQGYSAIYLALARAQDIPTRFVYGHRLSIPSNDWYTEDNIEHMDHWWCESYVNGRWIFVDPTVGTTNKYNKNTGVWTYTGLTNFTYFDPSDEQIATSHVYMGIYPDFHDGRFISNEYEKGKLREFFAQTGSAGTKTNGLLINEKYTPDDTWKWRDGTKSHFLTDANGKTTQLKWDYKGFGGSINLPSFTKLKLFSSQGNDYESANLSNCYSLSKVYLQSNGLTSINLANCYKLSYVRAQNNPLKSAKLYVNDANRTITAGDNGTFYFTLDTRYTNSSLSIYSKPAIGYKLGGIYNTSSGKKYSSKSPYHFTPKASSYTIKFVLNPDSYKYYLKAGESRSSRVAYIRAVAKRLNELGYYNPTSYSYSTGQVAVGEEKSFTDELVTATTKFQVVNDITNTGNIGESTWSVLFSDSAKSMVAESEYANVLATYEQNKVLRAEAKTELSTLSVNASYEAKKGSITVTWELINAETLEGETVQIDGYELYKSTAKDSGYTLLKSTTGTSIKNTSNLKKGTRYYYKVRAYREIGGKRIYSAWSNVTYKKAK